MYEFTLSAFSDEVSEDLKRQIDVLHRNKINCMEIRGIDGRNIIHYSEEKIEEIKKILDSEDIGVSSIGSPVGKSLITDDFSATKKAMEKAITVARILGAPYIRIFSFYLPEDENPENYKDEIIWRLGQFIQMAVQNNVVLLIENEKNLYGDTPQRCLEIMKTLSCKNLKMVFDPANFVQCGAEAYLEAYGLLKPYISYVHIKDAVRESKRNVLAGKGDGNIREILADLKQSEYRGFLSLEPHLYAFEGLADLEKEQIQVNKTGNPEELFSMDVHALQTLMDKEGLQLK